MGLVDYSDSDASDEEIQIQHNATAATSTSSKQSFQKVVDKSNPSKIKVTLPAPAPIHTDDTTNEEGRPVKRARTGGGGLFSELNSFLPAPKRSGDAPEPSPGAGGKKLGLGRGLGSGVSLRTGATPAFSREAPTPLEPEFDAAPDNAVRLMDSTNSQEERVAQTTAPPEVKLVGKATMFRPLSVARNKQKKKKPLFVADQHGSSAPVQTKSPMSIAKQAEAPKAKLSLFSMTADQAPAQVITSQEVTEMDIDEKDVGAHDDDSAYYDIPYEQYPQTTNSQQTPQTLDHIASELNLDAAAKRQLFGRRGRGDNAPINLVNFDTDKQYMANEELRAAGETVQHNALRSVQPGKHSLRQLVSAASTQKEALEESWAAGRRNKKEAGTKYGW